MYGGQLFSLYMLGKTRVRVRTGTEVLEQSLLMANNFTSTSSSVPAVRTRLLQRRDSVSRVCLHVHVDNDFWTPPPSDSWTLPTPLISQYVAS